MIIQRRWKKYNHTHLKYNSYNSVLNKRCTVYNLYPMAHFAVKIGSLRDEHHFQARMLKI